MSKGKRFTEVFRIEVVKQVTDRRYSVDGIAERLGVTIKSLYNWRSQLADNNIVRPSFDDSVRTAKLEADLKRVTEGRDILKNVCSAAIFQRIVLLIYCVGQPELSSPRPHLAGLACFSPAN